MLCPDPCILPVMCDVVFCAARAVPCPIMDRFFHSFELPPRLLVVAPHLQQDELYSLMDLTSGLCSGCLHVFFCYSASWRGVGGESRQERALPLGSTQCLPSTDAAWGSLHWDLGDVVLWSLAVPMGSGAFVVMQGAQEVGDPWLCSATVFS